MSHIYFPAWALQNELNGWDVSGLTPPQIIDHYKLVDQFTINLDESCMVASDGNLHIIASKSKKKSEKNVADSRESITVVRVGSAGGIDGPRFYLAKGKEIELATFKKFTDNYSAPAGSRVIMTPNAYMTDEAWSELVPSLCEGIRSMHGIKDHPDCWVVLSLDGFGSHLGTESLLVFHQNKILVIKEEGDTSHISQAYDQMVARADKRKFSELLDTFKAYQKGVLNQWAIILIVNEALNAVAKTNAWVKSFIRVNFCPSYRKPFAEWLLKYKGTVDAADFYFKSRTGLYDAMPACWKNMTEQERRAVAAKISTFSQQWTKENIKDLLLLPGVKFDDIEKLRGCYLISREDPSIFVTPIFCADDDDDAAESQRDGQRLLDMDYAGFAFAPSKLMTPYRANRSDVDASSKLFRHMTNFVARNHGYHSGAPLLPSPHLDIEVSSDQVNLLNPTPRDVQIGAIIDQCTGEAAKKVIAKRRIDIVTGNINSYARVLNGPHQLDKIQTYNELAATMAVLKQEREQQQEQQREKKRQEEQAKAARRAVKEMEADAKARELEPVCRVHVNKGIEHVLSLKVRERKDILRYHFRLATVDIDDVSKSVYKLTSAEANIALKRLMPALPQLPPNDEGNIDGDCNDGGGDIAEAAV